MSGRGACGVVVGAMVDVGVSGSGAKAGAEIEEPGVLHCESTLTALGRSCEAGAEESEMVTVDGAGGGEGRGATKWSIGGVV